MSIGVTRQIVYADWFVVITAVNRSDKTYVCNVMIVM